MDVTLKMQQYRALCRQIWNEVYVPSFPEFQELNLAYEGFDECCRNLIAACVYGESDYDSYRLLFEKDGYGFRRKILKFRVAGTPECQKSDVTYGACIVEGETIPELNFVDLFDWDFFSKRDFEYVDGLSGEGVEYRIRFDDISEFFLDLSAFDYWEESPVAEPAP